MTNWGEKIRAIRKYKGMTQKDVAKRAYVDHKVICFWETGRNLPRIDLLDTVLRAMGYKLAIVPMEEDEKQ